ncbi:hypothetical protein HYT23_02275 [Candidatus Pacearchaeota archaeon]|nr:hypothetical protein [Candidatus Pacearchaeota archaeon]
MKKVCNGRYPDRGEEQHEKIAKALVSMLNCRRYLTNLRFAEEIQIFPGWNLRRVNFVDGTMFFPEGLEIDNDAFCKINDSNSRDALLKVIISKDAKFKRNGSGCCYDRSRIVRTSYEGSGYSFRLSVRDTTKESLSGIFLYDAKKFAFQYDISLNRDIITVQDLGEFARYKQGLENAMRHDSLITYSPQAPQGKEAEPKKAEMPQAETHFINPWDIKIPRLEGKRK